MGISQLVELSLRCLPFEHTTMKTTTILSFLLFVSIASCQNKPKEKEKNYVLITEDGISVEKFDSTNVDQNRFTENNTTFREGIAFTYNFEHLTPTDEKLLFTWVDNADHYERAWKFVPMDSIDESTIKKVKITVKPGLEPMIKHIPDYNQTIIQYVYLTENGKAPFSGSSGVTLNPQVNFKCTKFLQTTSFKFIFR